MAAGNQNTESPNFNTKLAIGRKLIQWLQMLKCG